MSKQAYSSFSSEDELDHLFAEQKGVGMKEISASNTGKKTMMENVMENLDKVLICLAVLLLVAFFVHSQPHHRSKQVHRKVGNAVETSQQMPIEKANYQMEKGKIGDVLETYKAKMLLYNKKRQESKDNLNLHKSANQVDDSEDISAKLSQKYAEGEKYSKHEARSELFNEKAQQSQFQSLKLARFNLETPKDDKQQKTLSFSQQKRRLQQKYSIQQQYDQLSMCIVVYARLLKKDYAHQYVLQSIFNQEYNEYSVVYIADGHSEDQVGTIKQYLKEKDHNNRVTLVWNKERKYFLESTVNAVKSYCQKRSVTALIDGNDELLGGQVFNLLNVFYRREGYNLLYGNFIEYYDSHKQFNIGFSSQYQQSQKQSNSYRIVPQKFGNIKTFKTRLLSFIKQSDLKDIYGNYYKQAGDYALMYPLLELSCGKVGYLPEYNYLYYGEEVDPESRKEQANNGMAIKAMEQYQCFTVYK